MSIRTKRNSKRVLAGLIAGSFALSGLAVSSSAAAEEADVSAEQVNVSTLRVGGADRYATSAQIASLLCTAWSSDGLLNRYLANPNKGGYSTSVIIASGENWPDGLAASGLASYLGPQLAGGAGTLPAPVLLVNPNSIPAATAAAIKSIDETCGIDSFFIVGGLSAVGANVSGALTATAPVSRLAGATRYDTALAVANFVAEINPAFGGLNDEFGIEPAEVFFGDAIIATGDNFADALSASTYAAAFGVPVLLTPSSATSLSAALVKFLQDNDVERVFVMGGNGAVPSSIQTQLSGIGVGSVRYGGATRYDTSAQFAGWWLNAARKGQVASNNPVIEFLFGEQITDIVLTTGEKFPDALSVGPAGGTFSAPVLLTLPNELPEAAQGVLTSNRGWTSTIWVAGGTSAVSDAVVTKAVELSTIPDVSITNRAGLWGRQDNGATQWTLVSDSAAVMTFDSSATNPLSAGVMGIAWDIDVVVWENPVTIFGDQFMEVPVGPCSTTYTPFNPAPNVYTPTGIENYEYLVEEPTTAAPEFIVLQTNPGECALTGVAPAPGAPDVIPFPARHNFNIVAIVAEGTTTAQLRDAWNATLSDVGGLFRAFTLPGQGGVTFQAASSPEAYTIDLSAANGSSNLRTWTEFNKQVSSIGSVVGDAINSPWGGVGVCNRLSAIPNNGFPGGPTAFTSLFGTQLLGVEPLLLPNLGTAPTGCNATNGFGPGGYYNSPVPTLAIPDDGNGSTMAPDSIWTNAGRRQVIVDYAFSVDTTDFDDAYAFAWAYLGMTDPVNKPAAVFSPGAVSYCEPVCTPSPGVGDFPGININRGWVDAFLTRNDAVVNAFWANPTTNVELEPLLLEATS